MGRSPVWKHFTAIAGKNSVKCDICGHEIKTSTRTMKYHLIQIHKVHIPASKDQSEEPPAKKVTQSKITAFVKKQYVEEVMAEMTAKDGFTFHAIANSSFIRKSLTLQGLQALHDPKTVAKMVLMFANDKKHDMAKEIEAMIQCGKRFSASLDEYTSIKNRRLASVNLHSKDKYYSLGLVRIDGSLSAACATELLREKLLEFKVSLDSQIVAMVSDGAAMMLKMGHEIQAEHRVCLAHGMHLAVIEILYKTKAYIQAPGPDETNDDSFQELTCDDDLIPAEEEDFNVEEELQLELVSDLAGIIKKIREVVRLFRISPVRNDALQKEIKKEIGKELQWKLDCRTRWNSFHTMIETILKVKKSVIQTLADLNNDFIITDQDFDTLEMIGKSLKPVKMATKALCRRDATLLVAEGIFRFLLEQLQRHNHNWLSQALHVAILKRVQERRQRNVISLMRFLSCPSTFTQHDNEPFTMPTRLNIQKCAKSLILRLFLLYRPDEVTLTLMVAAEKLM